MRGKTRVGGCNEFRQYLTCTKESNRFDTFQLLKYTQFSTRELKEEAKQESIELEAKQHSHIDRIASGFCMLCSVLFVQLCGAGSLIFLGRVRIREKSFFT